MPHRPPAVPLYQRVFAVLHRRIRAGVHPPGSALSTEDQLAAEFGVSKATVRQAIGELVRRGMVVRHQGKGTFVAEEAAAAPPPHAFVGSLADLVIGTHGMSVRDYTVERDAPFPLEIGRLLGTGSTGTLLRHHRDIDGTAFAYAVVYLSETITRVLSPAELLPSGRATLLNERGVRISGARQSMSAELADVEVAEHLGIEFGDPVLFSERVMHTADGPVEVVHTWYRGDLYKWEAELSFTWSPRGLVISVDPQDAELTGAAPPAER